MNTKKKVVLSYFIIIFMVYILDLITTVIGLSLGGIENNPIASNIFNMNYFGSIIGIFIFISFMAALMLCLVELIYAVYKKLFKENLKVYSGLLFNGLLIILWDSVLAIINNLNVIFNLKGG